MGRRAFIAGGYVTNFIGPKHPDFIWKRHPEFGKRENPNLEDYIRDASIGALEATGTPAALVDKLWIGNFCGELFSSQGHLGAALVGSHPDFLHKPSMKTRSRMPVQAAQRPRTGHLFGNMRRQRHPCRNTRPTVYPRRRQRHPLGNSRSWR